MWIMQVVCIVVSYFKDFWSGMSNQAILEKRIDTFLTVMMAIFCYKGFAPLFNFIKAIFEFIKYLIFGLFSVKQRTNYLEKRKAKEKINATQLEEKLRTKEIKIKALEAKLDQLYYRHQWEEKNKGEK